ncbi:MAG: hypothetical protein WC747_04480 [Candidatus Babeliales bacterium]
MKISIKDFPQRKLDQRIYKEGVKDPEVTEGIWVIMASDIEEYMPPNLYTKFNQWMSGQTVTSIGSEAGYYLEDVERFLQGKGVID